uniref:C-type lectin domain-containing protein n=1 Tax=Labrus bergylta TaxID=56723 RepID=A0A3Q3EDN0_9LABR
GDNLGVVEKGNTPSAFWMLKYLNSLGRMECTTLFWNFSRKNLCLRQFHYIDLKLNWLDAQHYCREKYDDLATIQSMEDIIQLKNQVRVSGNAWIGLRDHPNSWFKVMGIDANSWRWSVTGETSQNGYQNWFSTAPDNMYLEYCIVIDGAATWNDVNCDTLLSFVCYTGKKMCFVF